MCSDSGHLPGSCGGSVAGISVNKKKFFNTAKSKVSIVCRIIFFAAKENCFQSLQKNTSNIYHLEAPFLLLGFRLLYHFKCVSAECTRIQWHSIKHII